MTILTIRSGKRYAVRRSIGVSDGTIEARGLLIELAQEGCRVSNLEVERFTTGDAVVLNFEDRSMGGVVRWTSAGVIGVRFEDPLFTHQLNDLIAQNRPEVETLRYGT